ncbi:HAD-IIIA family hydrolase [Neisseria montereyensis]|uniref:HAD-IIIA family hydrolase n=1 Tax=Neisseria montereyensis TaxID=2973938 RepID=A0ABT2FCZ5_9NEIS|nr:HAD-IIIA family hydrolase [Neisseria montereyensis]MCS4534081.1 HAD-IIIA family hydrolase [Neisseria montereyensis]
MLPRLIIFDWDGTLADTTVPIITTMQQTFIECGLPEPKAETVRALIGFNLSTMIRRLAPEADLDLQEKIAQVYTRHYLNPNNHNMKLFDSAIPCLQTLRAQGYWLAVATGKGRAGLDKAIKQTQTADFWLATICADESLSKPAPDMVLRLCDELGVDKAEAVVVGDTVHDLQMAANAGVRAIAVSTGAHSVEQLRQENCLAILDDLSELPPFIAGLG